MSRQCTRTQPESFIRNNIFTRKEKNISSYKNDQSIEITFRHKYISATQQLIIEFGAFLLSVWVLHSHQKCRQWNSNDIQEFFLGKKRTNLMVVRPILPVVESRSIEGGRLIGTPIFGRLHFFPYSSIASWEAAIAEKYRMVKGTNLLLSSNVTMRRYGDNSLVKWLTSNCLDLGKNQVVYFGPNHLILLATEWIKYLLDIKVPQAQGVWNKILTYVSVCHFLKVTLLTQWWLDIKQNQMSWKTL